MVDELTSALGNDRNLFPGSFIIRALRDSRYNNSAYAISELIDNSIEAGAERIQLLCMEERKRVTSRITSQLTQLAVLDNGEGMDRSTLMHALRFGIGTRYDSTSGIGKYGMGLPTSSMSQCKRVDVWSWQDGVDSAWHSWIDADEIEGGNHDVPVSDQEIPIPKVWKEVGHRDIFEHKSGTLVVWSNLDRLSWRTGKTVIANTVKEVGRIHRYYIREGLHKITAISFLSDRPNSPEVIEEVVPNDPLYLMVPSSVPEAPWDQLPMFKKYGREDPYTLIINGKETPVTVKYSIVKQEALETETVTQNPGATPRGQHARHNIGVSVVREGREITLERAFQREGGSVENPRNRWWGCEVEFFRDADDLFGVDHNKQMVSHFTQAARAFASVDARDTEQVLDELGIEEGDDRYQLYMIVKDIRNETRSLERQLEQMFQIKRGKQRRDKHRTPEDSATRAATDADREAIVRGDERPTATDRERERQSTDERLAGLEKEFVEHGQTEEEARELAQNLVREGLTYQFLPAHLDGHQMFSVRSVQGVLHIYLNTAHPIYDWLQHIEDRMHDDVEEDDPAYQSIVAIRLLLSSWARMEDHTESEDDRVEIQETARNWGRHVRKVVRHQREQTK